MADFIPISDAVMHTKYSADHIRYLVRHKLVSGRKLGPLWLVDLANLQEYEKEMDKIGKAKHRPKSLSKG